MNNLKIPFNKPFIVGKELYYIAKSVISGHLSGDGYFTKHCHEWLEEQLKCPFALLTHSCTAALEMSAILCNIQQGDEVIMPSFTFVSTANAFVLRGAVPVFIDIKLSTLNIDENLIEAAITQRTKAIVPVHYAGVACEMDTIMKIAKKYNLLVIEDAAQALLSTYNKKYLGTIGDLGCLSFHETKNIISGEGGALLINNIKLKERAEIIREKGTNRSKFFRGEVDKYTWIDIGSSYLPSELVAAFLYAQMEQASVIIAKRQEVYQQYMNGLIQLQKEGHILLPNIGNSRFDTNGHIFYIITKSLNERTKLINYLRECGIYGVFHYVPLHSSPAGTQYARVSGELKNTDNISERLLRLPIYYEISVFEVEKIIETIYKFYSDI